MTLCVLATVLVIFLTTSGRVSAGEESVAWRVGTTHTYTFQSDVSLVGSDETGEKTDTKKISGRAAFHCHGGGSLGPYSITMTLSDVKFVDSDGTEITSGEDVSSLFTEKLVVFQQSALGTVSNVMMDKDETAYVSAFKKGIISTIQSHLGRDGTTAPMTDAVGAHDVYVERLPDGTTRTTFDDDDIDNYPDSVDFTGVAEHTMSGEHHVPKRAVVRHRARFVNDPVQLSVGSRGANGRLGDSSSSFVTSITTANTMTMDLVSSTVGTPVVPDLSGHVAVSLSVDAAELSSAVEMGTPEDIIQSVVVWIDDITKNLRNLPDAQLVTIAHELTFWCWKHHGAVQEVVDRLRVVVNPVRPELVAYVVQHGYNPPPTSSGRIEPQGRRDRIEPHVRRVEPEAGRIEPHAGRVEPEAGRIEPHAGRVEPEAGRVEPYSHRVGRVEPYSPSPVGDAGCDPSFPHCRQKEWSAKVGPKDFSLNADAGYFAGTNLDCTHDHLNYKLRAYADAYVDVFGHTKDLLTANAVYSAIAGATSENRLTVKLWTATLKDEPLLPITVPGCPPETVKNLWQMSPGLSVGVTIMVGPVPVKFDAAASAQLKLDWGYLFCPQDLQARVDLQPSVTVIASATAEVSIVIARAGIQLSGSINQKLVPEAWINGNKCAFGVDLRHVSDPTVVKLDAFLEHRSCSFHHWHLSCGWSGRKEWDIWKWEGKATDEVIWGEECDAVFTPSFSLNCHSM